MGWGMGAVALLAVMAADTPSNKIYEVRYLTNPQIAIDGQFSEPAWQQANLESGFGFPWRSGPAPSTHFRALCDDENLYFLFQVHDEDVVAVKDFRDEMDAIGEDRVEFYFAPDLKLNRYYCIEMDSRGRTLDYRAAYYRRFDFSWSFPGLRLKTSPLEQGYVVEGAIRLRSFRQLGLPSLDSGQLRVGVFRAEFSHGPGSETIENWIAWVDPRTPFADFHVRSSLGVFRIAK